MVRSHCGARCESGELLKEEKKDALPSQHYVCFWYAFFEFAYRICRTKTAAAHEFALAAVFILKQVNE